VVTIRSPLPGFWRVEGIEAPEGFATLLSDIKLQVRWPKTNLNVGDRVQVVARLVDGDEVFSAPGLEDVLFFSYKIVDPKSSETILNGSLNDDGKEGDLKAGDKLFSTVLQFNNEGYYRALIGVTSPTFNRQQLIPFSVLAGTIGLTFEKGDEFASTEDRFLVAVSAESIGKRKHSVDLVLQEEHAETALAIPMDRIKGEKGRFELKSSAIPAGEYEVFARLIVRKKKGEEETFFSNALQHKAEGTATTDEEPKVKIERRKPESHAWVYAVSIGIAVIWSALLSFLVIKRFKGGKGSFATVKPYEVPEELQAKLSEFRAKVSELRRDPADADLAMLDVSVSGLSAPKRAAKPAEEGEGATEEEGEAAASESTEEDGGGEQAPEAEGEEATTEEAEESEEIEKSEEAGEPEEADEDAAEESGEEESPAEEEPAEDAADEEDEETV